MSEKCRVARVPVVCLFILLLCCLAFPVASQEPITCQISTEQDINKRNGPGMSFSIIGVLSAQHTEQAVGQSSIPGQLAWWRLGDGAWVRSDSVTETGECAELPQVSSLSQTLGATTVISIAPDPEPTTESALFQIGDDVIVGGENDVRLIYETPKRNEGIVEATISGVRLVIVGGPHQAEEETWWQVQSPSGLDGWILESVDGQHTLQLVSYDTRLDNNVAIVNEVVVAGPSIVLLIHIEPDLASTVVEAVVSGLTLAIVDGPEVINGARWYRVRSISGNEGWVPEEQEGEIVLLPADMTPSFTATAVFQASATSLPTPTFSPTQLPCLGVVPPLLAIGLQGVVAPGVPNRIRQSPSTSSTILGLIRAGQRFMVVGGPACANEHRWWQIEYEGLRGWTAEGNDHEYYVLPID